MSAIPDPEIALPTAGFRGLTPIQFAALAVTLAVLGLSTIWPALLTLWGMWTSDALKSIGMVIPLVSLVLILRAWRPLGWQAEGTWWGLPILMIAMAAGQLQQRALLLFVISPHWVTALLPPSLILLAYGSGIVLLIGGIRLFRAALFPILLLWFANPVPHVFSLLVDLPLQTASAHIARAFAMHLGQPLTPDHLRLMFTPEFGMFIAPGCNGIRGSITMGFIALIAGYLYRFRWYATGLVVVGAILLGYVFNLARLCLLVLYYLVALHFTSLQNKAENADYLIGAALFLVATFLLFTVIHRLRDATNRPAPEVVSSESSGSDPAARGIRYAQLATMAAIALVGCTGLSRIVAESYSSRNRIADAAAVQQFPAQLGSYTLVRSWSESLSTGPIVYQWAQYAPAGQGRSVSIGVSPLLDWHDPIICHAIRDEHPLWQGQLTIATADAVPINFSSALYNDGVTQFLEVSTQCSNNAPCGDYATERTHFGFVYSRLDPKALLNEDGQRSIPVLVRAETADSIPADIARQQLTRDVTAFLASVKLDALAQPYIR